MRIRRRSRPWLPLWGSWRASGEPERAQAVASLHIGALIAVGYPLSHDAFSIFATAYALSVTAYAVPALPKGEPRGGCAAQLDSHPLPNRVTPNGVGQLPGSQTRHCLRGHPALSVTAFSRASSPKGRAKGRALPAQRTENLIPKSSLFLSKPPMYDIIYLS